MDTFSTRSHQDKILNKIGKYKIPANKSSFRVRDWFVDYRNNRNTPLHLGLDRAFEAWFKYEDGKIEPAFDQFHFHYYRLGFDNLSDSTLIRELGGADKAESTMSQICSLLLRQFEEKKGPLRIDQRFDNVFYVKDQNGVLKTITLQYHEIGFNLYAEPIDLRHPDYSRLTYRPGTRIFAPAKR